MADRVTWRHDLCVDPNIRKRQCPEWWKPGGSWSQA